MRRFTSVEPVSGPEEALEVLRAYAYSRPRVNAAVIALAVDGMPRPKIAALAGLTKQGVRMMIKRDADRAGQ
jgi:hypothetical protein